MKSSITNLESKDLATLCYDNEIVPKGLDSWPCIYIYVLNLNLKNYIDGHWSKIFIETMSKRSDHWSKRLDRRPYL